MGREIRIDYPGAGEWVMAQLNGLFDPERDHSFTTWRDGEILGGFTATGYTGAAMFMHAASVDPYWLSRDLGYLAFDYGLNQLGCRKLLAAVHSDNDRSLSFCQRTGWQIESVIRDALPDGHIFILATTRESCTWLRHRSRFRRVA